MKPKKKIQPAIGKRSHFSARVFWFSYHAPTWEVRGRRLAHRFDFGRSIHQVRDAMAFALTSPALFSSGFKFGGILLNLPGDGFDAQVPPDGLPHIQKGDVLFMATRPPISDEEAGTGRQAGRPISKSHTPLETSVLSTLHQLFFAHCSRARVRLCNALREAVELSNGTLLPWCDVQFFQNQSACYRSSWVRSNGAVELENSTAGYLFVAPRLLDCDPFTSPRLIGFFGLGGPETLTLGGLLATSLAKTFQEFVVSPHPRLLIVQWPVPRPPQVVPAPFCGPTMPLRPSSLDFLKQIPVEEKVDAECLAADGLRWVVNK